MLRPVNVISVASSTAVAGVKRGWVEVYRSRPPQADRSAPSFQCADHITPRRDKFFRQCMEQATRARHTNRGGRRPSPILSQLAAPRVVWQGRQLALTMSSGHVSIWLWATVSANKDTPRTHNLHRSSIWKKNASNIVINSTIASSIF